jgi:hypothetical protein
MARSVFNPVETKKIMGRPKLEADEIRNINICVAVNQKEFQKISTRSKLAEKRVAEYVRLAALNDKSLKAIPEINRESASYLRELQNLLNQLAALLEQNQIEVIDPITFIEMQKELRQMHHDFLNYGDN